jgi:hypothetical protein
MLDLVDEAFNQMSLAVQMLVIVALLFAITSRRHNDLHASLLEVVEKFLRIIAFVSQEHFKVEIFDKRVGLGLVVALTGSQ